MKTLLILGRIITNKEQAMSLIAQLSNIWDGSIESSVAILEVEDRLVKAGFLTWDDCELAEIA